MIFRGMYIDKVQYGGDVNEKEEGYYFDHRNFAFSDNFFYENKWGI